MNDRSFILEDKKNEVNSRCEQMLHDAEIMKNAVIKNKLVHNMDEKIMDLLESLYNLEKEFYLLLLQNIQV